MIFIKAHTVCPLAQPRTAASLLCAQFVQIKCPTPDCTPSGSSSAMSSIYSLNIETIHEIKLSLNAQMLSNNKNYKKILSKYQMKTLEDIYNTT